MKDFELKTIIGKPTEKSTKLRDEIIKLAYKITREELGIEEQNIKFYDIGVIDEKLEQWIITGENRRINNFFK